MIKRCILAALFLLRCCGPMPAFAEDGACVSPEIFLARAAHIQPNAFLVEELNGEDAAKFADAMNNFGSDRPLAADQIIIMAMPESGVLLVSGFVGGCGGWQVHMPIALYQQLRRHAFGVES